MRKLSWTCLGVTIERVGLNLGGPKWVKTRPNPNLFGPKWIGSKWARQRVITQPAQFFLSFNSFICYFISFQYLIKG